MEIIILLKFSNLKPCNWVQGYICQGEEVERTMTVVTIMSCQLICNEKSETIPNATSLETEGSFRDWWQSNYKVLDRKEESAFAHKVTAQLVYEKYCLNNGKHYSFEVFKVKTMQLAYRIYLSKTNKAKLSSLL